MVAKSELQELESRLKHAAGELVRLRDQYDADKTAESAAAFDKVYEDHKQIKEEIRKITDGESIKSRMKELEEARQEKFVQDGGKKSDFRKGDLEEERKAFRTWLRSASSKSEARLTEQDILDAMQNGFNVRAKEVGVKLSQNPRQYRSLTVGTDASGGYTVFDSFVAQMELSMLYFIPMRQYCTVIRTASGEDLHLPTVIDSANSAALVAEEASLGNASADPTVGEIVMKAYKYSSNIVKVSVELLDDSAFNLEQWLGRLLGERIGRGQAAAFTTGDNSSKPQGVVTGSSAGKTAASTTAITMDEIIELFHSVDIAYRNNPGAAFMMHDTIAAYIRKLKDSNNQYLWQPSNQMGQPDMLFGKPVITNNSMDSTLDAASKVVLFGDFSKYIIRDVNTVRFVRMNELYAATDQVGFVATLRSDGRVLDAGTDPIKHLITAAS